MNKKLEFQTYHKPSCGMDDGVVYTHYTFSLTPFDGASEDWYYSGLWSRTETKAEPYKGIPVIKYSPIGGDAGKQIEEDIKGGKPPRMYYG